ncbi:hypothetical protein KEM55_009223, partial [Ascosphaera atra]
PRSAPRKKHPKQKLSLRPVMRQASGLLAMIRRLLGRGRIRRRKTGVVTLLILRWRMRVRRPRC